MLRPILKTAYAKIADASAPPALETRKAMALGKRGTIVRDEASAPPPVVAARPDPRFLDRLQRELGKSEHRSAGVAAPNSSDQPSTGVGTVADASPYAEQRFAKRRKTKMKAIIVNTSGGSRLDCTIRDVSSTGVLIDLPVEMTSVSRAGDRVPPRFILCMPTERTEVDCELAWRTGNKLGARFVSPSRVTSAEPRRKPQAGKTQSASSRIFNRLFSN